MKIGGLQKLTLIDYPGKVACTVFLSGCNYRCPFCYNAELVLPEIAREHIFIQESDFFDFLKERKGLLEGVCVSGGEPTLHQDLPRFCQKIKGLGYKIKIDTNGSNPKALETLLGEKLIDYAAMDIKGPKEKYGEVIGFKNSSLNYLIAKIEKSISLLKENKIDYEFRTTVVPSLLEKEDIVKIANWIGPAKKYFLQNFQQKRTVNPVFQKIPPYASEYLAEIKKAIAPLFETCEIRN